ncbi:hypothetical protein EJ08DRAFT_730314 [Tothia fuscella]|uniref:Uncharacterized protein n=1 Tax=Tothia fuscella TaxID=1048955 RepID=A0A9P4U2S9_9PEZI|nr:hypothetical protein EJ08DRAFT_730314 [Tothia fuscella]
MASPYSTHNPITTSSTPALDAAFYLIDSAETQVHKHVAYIQLWESILSHTFPSSQNHQIITTEPSPNPLTAQPHWRIHVIKPGPNPLSLFHMDVYNDNVDVNALGPPALAELARGDRVRRLELCGYMGFMALAQGSKLRMIGYFPAAQECMMTMWRDVAISEDGSSGRRCLEMMFHLVKQLLFTGDGDGGGGDQNIDPELLLQNGWDGVQ